MTRIVPVAAALACSLVVPGAADAKKNPMTLQELAAASALIVVAKVESVAVAQHTKTYDFGWTVHPRTATARVLETWHGSPVSSVKFNATKTWACDESYAEVGETVVLFLEEPGEDGVRNIVNWGEGRLEIRKFVGADHVKLRLVSEFVPPGSNVVVVNRPEQGYPDEFLEMRALQKVVQQVVGVPPEEPVHAASPRACVVLAGVALALLLWRVAPRRRANVTLR